MADGLALRMKIAQMLMEMGDFKDALTEYRYVRRLLADNGTLKSGPGAGLLMKIGMAQAGLGKPNLALSAFQDARLLLEAAGELHSKNAARLLVRLGGAYASQGRPDEAVRELEIARRTFGEERMLDSPEGAKLFVAMGQAKALQGDFEGALAAYGQAKDFFDTLPNGGLVGTVATDFAAACAGIGDVNEQQGQLEEAVSELTAASDVLQAANATETLASAKIMAKLGATLARQGQADLAREACLEALDAFEVTGNLQSEDGAQLLFELGMLAGEAGNAEETLARLNKARNIMEGIGQLKSQRGATLLTAIGDTQYHMGNQKKALHAYEATKNILGNLAGPSDLHMGTNDGSDLQLKITALLSMLDLQEEAKRRVPQGDQPDILLRDRVGARSREKTEDEAASGQKSAARGGRRSVRKAEGRGERTLPKIRLTYRQMVKRTAALDGGAAESPRKTKPRRR